MEVGKGYVSRGDERRVFPRLEVDITAFFDVYDSTEETRTFSGRAYIRNISAGGVMMEFSLMEAGMLEQLLRNEKKLMLQFIIPGEGFKISRSGRVKWISKVKEDNKEVFLVGIQMANLSREERMAITRFIISSYKDIPIYVSTSAPPAAKKEETHVDSEQRRKYLMKFISAIILFNGYDYERDIKALLYKKFGVSSSKELSVEQLEELLKLLEERKIEPEIPVEKNEREKEMIPPVPAQALPAKQEEWREEKEEGVVPEIKEDQEEEDLRQEEISAIDDRDLQGRHRAGKIIKKILVTIVVLIIAAAGGWWFLKGEEESKEGSSSSTTKEAGKQDESKEGAEETSQKEQKGDASQVPEDAPLSDVLMVKRFDFRPTIEQLGTLKGDIETKISFKTDGTVLKIHVSGGDRVSKGDLIAQLDQEEMLSKLRSEKAAYNAANSYYEKLKLEVEQKEKLYNLRVITESVYKASLRELEGRESEVQSYEERVKGIKLELKKTNLYSPSSGIIASRNVEIGESVTPSTLIGTLITTNYVLAQVGIVEQDIYRVKKGQKVAVSADAYPDEQFSGEVETLPPWVGRSGLREVLIKIPNPQAKLLPGMTTRVKIILADRKNAIVVPSDAVRKDAEAPYVLVLLEGSKAGRKSIQTGYVDKKHTEVVDGLAEGDRVILSTDEAIKAGEQIRVGRTKTIDEVL